MDERAIEAYATLAGVVVSATGVIISMFVFAKEAYRARFRTSIDLALKCEETFNGPSFEEKRRKAASALLTDKDTAEAEPIYDFFEIVGFLVRKKAIDADIAWSMFYDWVHGYWSNGEAHIMKLRSEKKDRTLWDDFERLHAALLETQRKEANQSEPNLLSTEEMIKFLNEEKSILQS